MKYVYHVETTSKNPKTGGAIFLNFECRYPTLDLLIATLNDGEIVSGSTLFTRRIATRLYEIVERRPTGLGKDGVAFIQMPTVRFVEPGEVEGSSS